MNLTRRKFFKGLAIAPVAAIVAVKLPTAPPDNTSLILAEWTPTEYLGHTTFNGGSLDFWFNTPEGRKYMQETNLILKDLVWKEIEI